MPPPTGIRGAWVSSLNPCLNPALMYARIMNLVQCLSARDTHTSSSTAISRTSYFTNVTEENRSCPARTLQTRRTRNRANTDILQDLAVNANWLINNIIHENSGTLLTLNMAVIKRGQWWKTWFLEEAERTGVTEHPETLHVKWAHVTKKKMCS